MLVLPHETHQCGVKRRDPTPSSLTLTQWPKEQGVRFDNHSRHKRPNKGALLCHSRILPTGGNVKGSRSNSHSSLRGSLSRLIFLTVSGQLSPQGEIVCVIQRARLPRAMHSKQPSVYTLNVSRVIHGRRSLSNGALGVHFHDA